MLDNYSRIINFIDSLVKHCHAQENYPFMDDVLV